MCLVGTSCDINLRGGKKSIPRRLIRRERERRRRETRAPEDVVGGCDDGRGGSESSKVAPQRPRPPFIYAKMPKMAEFKP